MIFAKFNNSIIFGNIGIINIPTDLPKPGDEPIKDPLSKTEFNSLLSVINYLSSNQRVIIIIRHADRDSDKWNQTDPINSTGITNSTNVGKSIANCGISINDCYYGATDYLRTCQTCLYIATGRGDTNWNELNEIKSLGLFDGKTDGLETGLQYLSQYYLIGGSQINPKTYIDSNPTEFNTRVNTAINSFITLTTGKKLTFLATHDYYAVPIVNYATNGVIALSTDTRYTTNGWINFMAGAAIILNSDDSIEGVYPIKCLDSGYGDGT